MSGNSDYCVMMCAFVPQCSGQAIQRFGAKRVMVFSAGIMVAGSLLGTFAVSTPLLLISRALEGIALVAITIAGAAFIRESAPPERMATAIGIWSVWFALGSFAAGVISPLIFRTLGFEALWLIYAAFAVCSALAIRFIVKAPNSIHAHSSQSGEKPRYRELAKRDIIFHVLVFAIYNVLTVAVVSYLPTVLQLQGYEESFSGFISTLPMLISIGSTLLLGVISDRVGRVKPFMCGSLLVLACLAPLMFTTTGWVLVVSAVVLGIFGLSGAALVMVALLVLLPRVEVVPLALGIFSTMMGLGQFLGSALVPLLLGPAMSNWWFTAGVLFGIGILGVVLSLLCRYR